MKFSWLGIPILVYTLTLLFVFGAFIIGMIGIGAVAQGMDILGRGCRSRYRRQPPPLTL